MRVLVSGAAGFLGRHFVKHHLEQEDEVVAVDDLSGAGSHWVEGRYVRYEAEFIEWLRGRENDEYDRAYHFAAPVGGREKIENDPLYNAWSLALDAAFFRWAVGRVETAVYPSSSAVYGVRFQAAQGMALPEKLFDPTTDAWARPDELYGFTKMAGEVLAEKASRYGLHTLCIRPFSGYGEGQSLEYPVPAICLRAMQRQDPLVVWGSGHQSRDFIHVSDLVAATEAALAGGIRGYRALNLGSGEPRTFVEVARIAAEMCEYEPLIETDETKPEGVHARFSDPSRMLAIYQPKITLAQGLRRVMMNLAETANSRA